MLAAAYGALAVAGARRARRLAALAAIAAAAAAVVAAELLLGGSSHVTRSLAGGPAEVAGDLWRRLQLSYERIASDPFKALVVVAGTTALALLVVHGRRSSMPPTWRPLLDALAIAVTVSLLVNDSPNDVVLVGVTGYFTLSRWASAGGALAAKRHADERLGDLGDREREPARAPRLEERHPV